MQEVRIPPSVMPLLEASETTTPTRQKSLNFPLDREDKFSWKTLPFFLLHVAAFGVFFTQFSIWAVLLFVATYSLRMWAITAGYHRYFAHRSYKTSRAFQFFLAFAGCSSVQKGPLWWAAHHRRHHKYTDEQGDIHSPIQDGFWYSHVGWIVSDKYKETDYEAIKDFAKYPELRWLDQWHWVPGIFLAVGCFLLLGWSGLFWGFFLSTVVLYHCTFSINSLAHLWGTRRYQTMDGSRNNFLLALITGGEGWHNNHHHFMSSVKQGFFWWEIDTSYYVLKILSWVKLVRDLRLPPAHLLRQNQTEEAIT